MTGTEKTQTILREVESQTDTVANITLDDSCDLIRSLPDSVTEVRFSNGQVTQDNVDEVTLVMRSSELHRKIVSDSNESRINAADIESFCRHLFELFMLRESTKAATEYQRFVKQMSTTLQEINERRCMRVSEIADQLSTAITKMVDAKTTDSSAEQASLLDMVHHFGRRRFHVPTYGKKRRSSSESIRRLHITPAKLERLRILWKQPEHKPLFNRKQVREVQFLMQYINERYS